MTLTSAAPALPAGEQYVALAPLDLTQQPAPFALLSWAANSASNAAAYLRLFTPASLTSTRLQLGGVLLPYAIASVGSPVSAEVRQKLLAAYRTMDAYPEVGEVLAALKARGGRLAILSNGDPDMLGDAVRAADPSSRVVYVGTPRGIEGRVMGERGDELVLMDIAPLRGGGVKQFMRGAARAAASIPEARALVKKLAPDAVLSVGGYAGGPISLAAKTLGVPVALLEPNGVLGLSNKLLTPFVERASQMMSGAGLPSQQSSRARSTASWAYSNTDAANCQSASSRVSSVILSHGTMLT